MNQIPGKVEKLSDKFLELVIENIKMKEELARLRGESSNDKSSSTLLPQRRMVGGSREIIGTGDEFM